MKKLFIYFTIVFAIWFRLDDDTSYMQVPGGWIYKFETQSINSTDTNGVSLIFVPFYMVEPNSGRPFYVPSKPRP